MASAKLNDGIGFILREYNKKHECRLTSKTMKVTYTWVVTEIKKSGCCWPECEDWSFEELYARDLRFEN